MRRVHRRRLSSTCSLTDPRTFCARNRSSVKPYARQHKQQKSCAVQNDNTITGSQMLLRSKCLPCLIKSRPKFSAPPAFLHASSRNCGKQTQLCRTPGIQCGPYTTGHYVTTVQTHMLLKLEILVMCETPKAERTLFAKKILIPSSMQGFVL